MAGDWIKMRVDLYRDPKVIIMADYLMDQDSELCRYVNQHTQRNCNVTRNVMRNVTVGALVSVWGVMRTQGKRDGDDLVVSEATDAVVDDIADLPGFGDAMLNVGWLQQSDEGLVFPRFFEEHNADYDSQKAKNRERQQRYRERKKRNVTETLRNAPREEKRREDKELPKGSSKAKPEPPQIPASLDTPEFGDAWGEWEQHRKEIKKKLTPTAVKEQMKSLSQMGSKRAIEAIRFSIRNGYQGIFEDKKGKETAQPLSGLKAFMEVGDES